MRTSVLIVDDSRLVRTLIRAALPPHLSGDVREAEDGLQALLAVAERSPDVVLLDLTMPNMDGFEVMEWLAARGDLPAVFVVSADVQPRARARVLALGARAFVDKPLTRRRVRAVLEAHLGLREAA